MKRKSCASIATNKSTCRASDGTFSGNNNEVAALVSQTEYRQLAKYGNCYQCFKVRGLFT